MAGTENLLTAKAGAVPTAERPLRPAEPDELFATSGHAAERVGSVVRLRLAGRESLSDRVRDLAAREASCCSFFSFAVEDTTETAP